MPSRHGKAFTASTSCVVELVPSIKKFLNSVDNNTRILQNLYGNFKKLIRQDTGT